MTDSFASFHALDVSHIGHVLRIAFGDGRLNPVTPPIHQELSTIFRIASRSPDVRAIVLTGAGDRAFSAGGDLNGLASGIDDHIRWSASVVESREIVLGLLECDKPVIARINGPAVGLGATLALCCDITVMVDTARIGDPHVKIGLVAGDGGALIWPHLVGMARARRYLLTGDLLTGTEAAAIGLVTETVSAAELDARVDRWAARFVGSPAAAISLTKRALNTTLRQQAQTEMDAHLGLETLSRLSADHREAVAALIEKRVPHFTGL